VTDAAFLEADPVAVFRAWYDSAVAAGVPLADAMTLATATADGRPTARLVLFKGIWQGGFCFFTHYDSRKARDLTENPRAALVFHWHEPHRQVRIEGSVERLPDHLSDEYFQSRTRESQIGAWASPQSQPVSSREELDARAAEVDSQFSGRQVPRPPFWGGYRVVPERIELWIGQEHRLHDRFLYVREGSAWRASRLAP
jgi:pyridoxamine 5'-phosphate oxidase